MRRVRITRAATPSPTAHDKYRHAHHRDSLLCRTEHCSLASCTSSSSARGVIPPASSPNCSSRGKKPTPQAGQVPYVRVTFTASPLVVWMKRVCSPRAHSGLPHVAHPGRSSCGFWLQSLPSLSRTKSSMSCARN
jgi:hypothetical protein